MEYEKGQLLSEGKTKKVWGVVGQPDLVIVENKNDITANDNSKLTRQFASKATSATATTCRVFELLQQAGIPVAYIEQISPTEFVANNCVMIPLEVVARRHAVGSYTKRRPELTLPTDSPPHRFHRLVTEFFLKTTKGRLTAGGQIVIEGLDPEKGEEDPLILNPYAPKWTLLHSKKPHWDGASILSVGINPANTVLRGINLNQLEQYLRQTFLVLEGVWAILGCRLIDFKIEFGLDADGKLRLADVIDNDSWRLRNFPWKELSKEVFRQNGLTAEVEKNYQLVADLISRFRLPQQALIFWRGSDKDKWGELPKINGISVNDIVASGHKSPAHCLETLEKLLGQYPDGGVIIAQVGMSNGLGPMLAARTSWPVISVPATLDSHPEDIWSSLRLPSDVPMATICSEKNAIQFALNILAQKNPIAYALIQQAIEKLDG
ncbi:MAG: phosphoribosylaminoimidazolesuccinocarboxamide synthase [Patescibacteria group bacterium]